MIMEITRLNADRQTMKEIDDAYCAGEIREEDYNRTPIKAVTAVEQSPNEGRVHLHLTDSNGDEWGTVEW